MNTLTQKTLEYLNAVLQHVLSRRDHALADIRLRAALGADVDSAQMAANVAYSESELLRSAIALAERGLRAESEATDLHAFIGTLEARLKELETAVPVRTFSPAPEVAAAEATKVLVDQLLDWAMDHHKAVESTGPRGPEIIAALRGLRRVKP